MNYRWDPSIENLACDLKLLSLLNTHGLVKIHNTKVKNVV